jgi:hypothetical protein
MFDPLRGRIYWRSLSVPINFIGTANDLVPLRGTLGTLTEPWKVRGLTVPLGNGPRSFQAGPRYDRSTT